MLNFNIITYNANLNKYKELAIFLEKDLTHSHTELVSTYVKTAKFLAHYIKLDMQNSVSGNYSSLLSYFKTIFEIHAFNLFNKIQHIQEYVISAEEALKISGWLLIRGIWMVNHTVFLPDRPSPQQQNFSAFVHAISRETQYVIRVSQKIIKKFENIHWLYKFLEMTTDNKIWDLDTFLTTQIVD